MKILLLTSTYPSKYRPKGTTPVVHYFCKEWVRTGNQVYVIHLDSVFPRLYYLVGKLFKKMLDARLGHLVPVQASKEYVEERDGVKITHLALKKVIPHGRYSSRQLEKALSKIISIIKVEGAPDCFVGHWDNPQLEVLSSLKTQYGKPTCLVFHCNTFEHLNKIYGSDTIRLLNSLDLIGFRNETALQNYKKRFDNSNLFVAASGVSSIFIKEGESDEKQFSTISNFVYVGLLMQRKYPKAIVEALKKSYKDESFDVTFIGEGDEKQQVLQTYHTLSCKGNIKFTGRIPREQVIQYLKEADVFAMISKDEIFGLVYLEAMALGCITIASRHEGIDGIIEDGVNGFLCEAGNVDELSSIITKIRLMSLKELSEMSQRAKQTAIEYSDVNVALRYLNRLKEISKF